LLARGFISKPLEVEKLPFLKAWFIQVI
jgi:hypothetical protein